MIAVDRDLALPWDVVQKKTESDDPDSPLSYYRRLGQLRRNVPGLRAQRLQMIWPQSPMTFARVFRGDEKTRSCGVELGNSGTVRGEASRCLPTFRLANQVIF